MEVDLDRARRVAWRYGVEVDDLVRTLSGLDRDGVSQALRNGDWCTLLNWGLADAALNDLGLAVLEYFTALDVDMRRARMIAVKHRVEVSDLLEALAKVSEEEARRAYQSRDWVALVSLGLAEEPGKLSNLGRAVLECYMITEFPPHLDLYKVWRIAKKHRVKPSKLIDALKEGRRAAKAYRKGDWETLKSLGLAEGYGKLNRLGKAVMDYQGLKI